MSSPRWMASSRSPSWGGRTTIMGEVPVAFVSFVAGGGRSPEALLEEARRILAPYKLPVEVVIESALPRNSVGKITKGVLWARLQAR